MLGGLAVGILIFIFPPLFGEGYIGLQHLMSSHPESITKNSFFYLLRENDYFLILFLLGILFLKVVASSITTSSGGIGGVFAPALFTGGILGFVFTKAINLTSLTKLSEHNFTLVGMAGVMAGIMHAPMTSIFLIAEITGGYSLLFPLIITSTIAYLVKYHFDKHSVYTYNLKRKNEMITHNKDKEAIRRMNIQNLIEKNFVKISISLSFTEFINNVIPSSSKKFFIVEDTDQKFRGYIILDDLINILLHKESYESLKIEDLITKPSECISLFDDNETIFRIFDNSKSLYLPVVENNKFIGMLSKSKLLDKYRKLVVDFSED